MALITAFQYQRQLTFNTTSGGANVATNQSNFPICVVVNSSSWSNATERGHFFSAGNTGGKRVQFYDADGTTNLAYEVESYDGAGQTAVYWVKVPQVDGNSSTDHIHVGYGSDPNGSDQNASTVFSNSFGNVYHLGGNFWAGSSPQATSSTGTANGIDNGTVDAAGMIGRGRLFDGTDDSVDLGSSTSNKPAAVTMSAWVKATTWTNAYTAILAMGEGTPSRICFLGIKSSGKLALYVDASSMVDYDGSGTYTLSTGTWYHVALVYDSVGGLRGYVNGLVDGSVGANGALPLDSSDAVWIGGHPTIGGRYHDGVIDEARISSVARSADWVKLEYYSAKSTSWNGDGWLTWGSEAANVVVATATGGAFLVTGRTSTATGGSVLRATSSSTVTGAAWLQKTGTAVATGSAFIAVRSTATGSAVLQRTASTTATGAAWLLATRTATVTGGAWLRATEGSTTTGSAILQKTASATATGGAQLQATVASAVTGAAILRATGTSTAGGSAVLRATVTGSATGGAVSVLTAVGTVDGSSWLRATVVAPILGSAVLRGGFTSTATGGATAQMTASSSVFGSWRIAVFTTGHVDGGAFMVPQRPLLPSVLIGDAAHHSAYGSTHHRLEGREKR